MVIWMFVKVPDLLPDAGAPAGSDDRLLSGMPGSSHYCVISCIGLIG